jgi:mannose-6-phosphate isomerase-like protein (cupin superfamily)
MLQLHFEPGGTSVNEPFIVPRGEGVPVGAYDADLRFKARSAETNGAFSMVEGVWQPGGFAPLPHIHIEQEESFYVLEGQFNFKIGEHKLPAGPGTFLIVPRGVLHSFAAAGNAPARLLFMHSPPLEGFFFELQKLSHAGPVEPAKIRALMGKWGMQAPEV